MRAYWSSLISWLFLGSIVVSSCFMPHLAQAQQLEEVVVEANALYRKGNFSEALTLYEQAISSGADNGHLRYNLANTYYRLGKLGLAIANYRRALSLLPGDPDIKYNLSLAREKTIDKIAGRQKSLNKEASSFLPQSYLNAYSLEMLALLLFAALCLSALAHGIRRQRSTKLLLFSTSALCLLWWSSFFFVRSGRDGTPEIALTPAARMLKPGVLLGDKIEVYSGNAETFQVVFVLHDGAEVQVDDQREGWVEIVVPRGESKDNVRSGWIRKEQVVIL